jgi:hypothetical protein
MRTTTLLLLALTGLPCHALQAADAPHEQIGQVLTHPLFAEPYVCSEHADGELPHLGDDLGQDCMIAAFDEAGTVSFPRLYRTDGSKNEDWFGWNRPVQSPCDCEVAATHVNPLTNQPGKPDPSRASSVILKAADGTMFVVAHLQALAVTKGDRVKAGDPVGHVGNNGYARAPHVHIGAWRGPEALQIRWDQREMHVR